MFLIFRRNVQQGIELTLNAEEKKHLKARRLMPGATIHIGDGESKRYSGILDAAGRVHSVHLTEKRQEPERVLFTAIAKGSRWDTLLEKTTELGVTKIQPVIFQHSVRDSFPAERSVRITLQAAAQSRRFRLPEVLEPVSFQEFTGQNDLSGFIVMDPLGEDAVSYASRTDRKCSLSFLVGPEAGYSKEEFAELKGRVSFITTGHTILRIETAAIAALSLFTPGQKS